MDSKQIGKLIYDLDLGKFNNKTKLFESNNKDNWWRDEESFNTIKYHPLNSNTNNLLYKEYEQEYLYEGLICSADPNKTKDILNRNAMGFIHDIRIVYNPLQIDMKTPVIDFFIYKEDYYDLEYGKLAYNELLTLINNLGYFVSGKKELSTIINIVIMPKFLYEVTDEIYKEDGILYHITPLQNKKKILQKGLIPKYKNYRLDNYPDRIYFYRSNQKNKLDLLCKNLSCDTCIKEWLILKINLKDKRSYKENDKSTMYRFFEDPKSQYGVFTYENIDLQCIEFYKEVKL